MLFSGDLIHSCNNFQSKGQVPRWREPGLCVFTQVYSNDPHCKPCETLGGNVIIGCPIPSPSSEEAFDWELGKIYSIYNT